MSFLICTNAVFRFSHLIPHKLYLRGRLIRQLKLVFNCDMFIRSLNEKYVLKTSGNVYNTSYNVANAIIGDIIEFKNDIWV